MGTEGDGAPAGAGTRWCGLAGMAGGALLMLFSTALAARQATDWQAGPTLGTPIHLPLMRTITTAGAAERGPGGTAGRAARPARLGGRGGRTARAERRGALGAR